MWDLEKHKKKFSKSVKRLVASLEREGLTVNLHDERIDPATGVRHDNVVVTDGENVARIAHHCFYRVSGPTKYYKEVGTGEVKELITVDISRDEYINTYIRAAIMLKLGRGKK